MEHQRIKKWLTRKNGLIEITQGALTVIQMSGILHIYIESFKIDKNDEEADTVMITKQSKDNF